MNDAELTLPTRAQRRSSSLSSLSSLRARVVLLALLGLVAMACSSAASAESSQRATDVIASPSSTVEPPIENQAPLTTPSPSATAAQTPTATSTAPVPTPTPHPVALADTELPPAPIGFDQLFANEPAGPQPISIEIEGINVSDADIIPVGVNEDLSFEVPPADQVGWYEFGPVPGEAGSAVLAAHIAYNGVDGVFRYLEDVEIGAIVVVGFDDGSSERYLIEEVTEYIKEELPDELFARDGKEQLALITCGGAFNYQLDSYESNTVAIAVPIG